MRRRASGVALAVGLNLLVLLALLTTGALPLTPPRGRQEPLVVSLIPDADNATQAARSPQKPREAPVREQKPPLPKPKIVLPAKPTIETPRELPWIEMPRDVLWRHDSRVASPVESTPVAKDHHRSPGVEPFRKHRRAELSPRSSSTVPCPTASPPRVAGDIVPTGPVLPRMSTVGFVADLLLECRSGF